MPSLTGNLKGDLIDQLESRYSVSRATAFNRLKYLGYQMSKSGDMYVLSEEQIDQLDKLNGWINEGGRLADFPKPNGLATVVDDVEQYVQEIDFESMEGDEELSHAELIRAAQNQAAGILIAENLLTAQLLKHPHLLPADLLKQVEQSKVAIAPKPKNPLVVAGEWLQKAKNYQNDQEKLQREQESRGIVA